MRTPEYFAAALVMCLIAAVASLPSKSSARPARLIGVCSGQMLAAMEEDEFPAGCDWIELINFEGN